MTTNTKVPFDQDKLDAEIERLYSDAIDAFVDEQTEDDTFEEYLTEIYGYFNELLPVHRACRHR